MTTAEPVKVERRKGSITAIKKLVDHRTHMLALYGELASRRPFQSGDDLMALVQDFCQSLVDYSADAHFRLYRYIDNQNERRMSAAQLAENVYPRIAESTQHILDFNDKYDTIEHCKECLKELEKDLSHLGELLADRIELEDRLVAALTSPRT